MAPTELHRMAPGERCDQCGTRKWYAEDALRYCRNGHRLEGYAEHDAGEDEFGTMGKTTRKKKEQPKHQAKKLAGAAGRRLYIEVLEQILRQQVWWLVKERKFPALLEGVVKSLWDARKGYIQQAIGTARDDSAPEEPQAEDDDGELSDGPAPPNRTWTPQGGKRLKLPMLVDTLAHCCLGCTLMRLPVTTADFHNWAQRGDIVFLTAVRTGASAQEDKGDDSRRVQINTIPKTTQERLPPEFHRSLQVQDHIRPGALLFAVQKLAIGFNVNCDIGFPALNYIPSLVQHLKDLTLPPESYLFVQILADLLEVGFVYPTKAKKRICSMDNPEVLLMALVVVATKLFHPLDGVERPPASHEDPRVTQIDWEQWKQSRKENPELVHRLRRGTEHTVTADQALTMDKLKLDDYMDFYERTFINHEADIKSLSSGLSISMIVPRKLTSFSQAPKSIRALFETPGPESRDADRGPSVEELHNASAAERFRLVNKHMRVIEPKRDEEVPVASMKPRRPERDFLPVWRTEDDLPDTAKVFYMEAARTAAVPLRTLINATNQVERRLELWCGKRGKERRAELSATGAGPACP